MRRGARIGMLWWVLLAAVFVSLVVFALLLGPQRALRIAGASALSLAIDGFAEDPGQHRIAVIDV
ncbi:MAG TPA: hypothetical protein VKG92_10805, partial [Flavobacteriales bacterium]|nr:hypothetical protein [Flavobacteriales bacterium]